jgi:hypothetical protein
MGSGDIPARFCSRTKPKYHALSYSFVRKEDDLMVDATGSPWIAFVVSIVVGGKACSSVAAP